MRELVSPWKDHLFDFYEYKKLCGYKYDSSESVIYNFDQYYSSLNINELKFSRDIIEPFLYLESDGRIGTQEWKASVLRQFGKYLFINEIIDNIYIIPPISKKGETEYIPYIYSKDELIRIIDYLENYPTSNLPGAFNSLPNMINAVTMCTKILITTGMRLGEVINLKISNIDFEEKLFYIDVAKNDNKRIIPISETLLNEIITYMDNTPFPLKNDCYLLYTNVNKQIGSTDVSRYFYKALKSCGIEHKKHKGPRIHDFRHTFAVMSLTQLQKNEENINLSISYLSSYLGHKSFHETQKYIWMTPILFKDIKEKMEDYSSFIMDIFGGEKFDED